MQKQKCAVHDSPFQFLCLSQKCPNQTISICNQKQCLERHQHPIRQLISIDKLNTLISNAYYSLDHLLPKVSEYFKKIKDFIVQRLDKDQSMLIYLIKRMEYCSNEQIYSTLKLFKNQQYLKLNPTKMVALIQQLQNPSRRDFIKNTVHYYETQIGAATKKVDELLKTTQYEDITLIKKFNNLKKKVQIQSSIVPDRTVDFANLLKKGGLQFSKFTLLYRGSEHNFSGVKFHNLVDNISGILLMVKSQTGNVFGSYLHSKLNSQKFWIADSSRKSFIFSLDHNTIHRLKKQNESKAAYGGSSGPVIGSGCDIYIGDQCHRVANSGAALGGSYELPEHMNFKTVESQTYLGGKQNFFVEEYEVYKID